MGWTRRVWSADISAPTVWCYAVNMDLEECFQYFAQSLPERIKVVLKSTNTQFHFYLFCRASRWSGQIFSYFKTSGLYANTGCLHEYPKLNEWEGEKMHLNLTRALSWFQKARSLIHNRHPGSAWLMVHKYSYCPLNSSPPLCVVACCCCLTDSRAGTGLQSLVIVINIPEYGAHLLPHSSHYLQF